MLRFLLLSVTVDHRKTNYALWLIGLSTARNRLGVFPKNEKREQLYSPRCVVQQEEYFSDNSNNIFRLNYVILTIFYS